MDYMKLFKQIQTHVDKGNDINVFLASGVLITRRLMEDGVDVRSHCWEYMPHVFLFLCDLIPEAAMAQDELAGFIQYTILSD